MSHRATDADTPAPDVPASVRVMTFNVRYDTDGDGNLAWPHRKHRVASVIRFHRPDVLGLQEPLEHQLAYLQAQLPEYEWVGVGRLDGAAEGEHGPVGFRRDRFALVDDDTFWLSETPHVPGSKQPEASYPRMATWAELRDARTDRRFVACNTHLEHRSAAARAESARVLRTRLADVAGDAPAVVTGDLNCTENDRPYEILTASGSESEDTPEGDGRRLFDAQYRSEHEHHGPTVTFNRFRGDPDQKIDYVFVTDSAGVYQHGVVIDHWDGIPPSDHAPVVADVRFEG